MEKMVSGLSAGSRTVYKKVFRLYYPRLVRYSGFLLKNNVEAEDLVQEVFIQLWENRANLKALFCFLISIAFFHSCTTSKPKLPDHLNQLNMK